ncbi:hypothetical protein [Aggregatilinea lenta]|uniref:hypothetical protein n=1 Tax=Aggregatilinea lenta TaxID=913108 RepID=UPI000E5B20EA|nr:hypothetical protein [Aggregatilinea lenta]
MPDSLVSLYEQGQRVRYNGFWLNASERDRKVAEIIDTFPQDVSEWVKDFLATLQPLLSENPEEASQFVTDFLHRKITGDPTGIKGLDELRDAVFEIRSLLQSGSISIAPDAPAGIASEKPDDNIKQRIDDALGNLPT